MDSKHDISAKLLRLSIEERVQRESARRERAKLMMIGYSFFAIFLILIVIVDSVVR
jgi:membrane-associated protease RseP (regulator of RpoE activity)